MDDDKEYEAEENLADEYMEEWNDWMNVPLGKPTTPTHLDSIREVRK